MRCKSHSRLLQLGLYDRGEGRIDPILNLVGDTNREVAVGQVVNSRGDLTNLCVEDPLEIGSNLILGLDNVVS